MRTFNVNVNGTEYKVTVEETEGQVQAPKAAAAPAPVAAPAAAPAPKAAPAPNAVAGGEAIKAPMPGTILAVNVTNGAAIKKGQVLMVLEAMKMENEILAPADGTVQGVNVQQGSTVETGTVLCTIA